MRAKYNGAEISLLMNARLSEESVGQNLGPKGNHISLTTLDNFV